jgi:hypothetical protein
VVRIQALLQCLFIVIRTLNQWLASNLRREISQEKRN